MVGFVAVAVDGFQDAFTHPLKLGIGGVVCPLVSTQFAQIPKWHYHYLCSLGVALIVCVSFEFLSVFTTN